MTAQKILLIGMPGSGKGTQAQLLLAEYDLPYLSTGEMFRKEMADRTKLGMHIEKLMNKGHYVTDGMTNQIVTPYLRQPSYLLDGYPRTLNQAHHLDAVNTPDLVVFLEVDEATVVDRVINRGKTSGRPEDVDTQVIQTRINLFYETMKPVIIHYSKQDKLHAVKSDKTPEEVHANIKTLIDD